MNIFLLEDDYVLNKAISQYLSGKGFIVTSFLNGADALNAISDHYSLMILDIDVPHLNGIVVMEEIRRLYPSKPIIIISATIEIEMIDKAYQKGCDDYVKKPFNIRELELKIHALTRSMRKSIIIADHFEYRTDDQQLFYHAQEIILTPKEKKLFHMLIENKGRTVAMEHLANAIWGLEDDALHLRQLVARLRKKLPENIIQNRTGSGYCIV